MVSLCGCEAHGDELAHPRIPVVEHEPFGRRDATGVHDSSPCGGVLGLRRRVDITPECGFGEVVVGDVAHGLA